MAAWISPQDAGEASRCKRQRHSTGARNYQKQKGPGGHDAAAGPGTADSVHPRQEGRRLLIHEGEWQARKGLPRQLGEVVQRGWFVGAPLPRPAPHRCPEHAPRARLGESRYGGRRLENNFCVSSLRGQSRYRRRNGYAGKESRRATATVGRDLRCKRKPIGRDQ